MTRLLLQIVTESGDVIQFPGGRAAEADLVQLCTDAIVAQGVGLFVPESQVKLRIEQGMTLALRTFKQRTVKG